MQLLLRMVLLPVPRIPVLQVNAHRQENRKVLILIFLCPQQQHVP
jgi:hypothetical protein